MVDLLAGVWYTDLNVDIRPEVKECLDAGDPASLGRHHQRRGPVLCPEVDMTHDPEGTRTAKFL